MALKACKKMRILKLSTYLLALAFCLCGLVTQAGAEDGQSGDSPVILHTPPEAGSLPSPGSQYKLLMQLQGTNDLELSVRALVVNDDRLMDVRSSKSYMDEREVATYEFNVLAPLAETSYQFVVYGNKTSPQLSERYRLTRSCLPRVKPIDIVPVEGTSAKERFLKLQSQSNSLERDLAEYDGIVNILNAFKEELRKKK